MLNEMSAAPPVDFHLVIPSYRESARLPSYLDDLIPLLARQPYWTRILIVDDGSGAEERKQLDAIVAATGAPPAIIAASHLERNMGKGYAVRHGWKAAQNARWLAFADADGATPAREVARVFDAIYRTNDPRRCYFGSRVRMLGRSVDRHWKRHAIGRLYATLVGMMINEGIYDAQCGFKVIPADAFAAVADLLWEDRFAFDSELVAALSDAGYPLEEIAVDWNDVPGSKVSVVKESLRMTVSLLFISSRKRRGLYRSRRLEAAEEEVVGHGSR
jgi:dolichyl-phosphate beta-glucosyltransferase